MPETVLVSGHYIDFCCEKFKGNMLHSILLLLHVHCRYRVTKVEYVVNPTLVKNFRWVIFFFWFKRAYMHLIYKSADFSGYVWPLFTYRSVVTSFVSLSVPHIFTHLDITCFVYTFIKQNSWWKILFVSLSKRVLNITEEYYFMKYLGRWK